MSRELITINMTFHWLNHWSVFPGICLVAALEDSAVEDFVALMVLSVSVYFSFLCRSFFKLKWPQVYQHSAVTRTLDMWVVLCTHVVWFFDHGNVMDSAEMFQSSWIWMFYDIPDCLLYWSLYFIVSYYTMWDVEKV